MYGVIYTIYLALIKFIYLINVNNFDIVKNEGDGDIYFDINYAFYIQDSNIVFCKNDVKRYLLYSLHIDDFKEQAIKKYTQGGGSGNASHHRTRYISDIKHNRRRLYDREREIIQSIRNFENNNNNNRHKSRHHKTRKLRNVLMRR